MFRMGGPADGGITSGLNRQGYKEAGSVDWCEVDVIADEMKKRYGAVPRQGYNVWDFLTEWGLNMASSPPMGNVIQTAAGTAKEPYGKMVEGKGRAGQLEYAMRAQAVDAASTQNLAREKMDLQEYLEGEKRKSGSLGCGLSHLKAINLAKENKMESILVIEDDCVFNENSEVCRANLGSQERMLHQF